jgi:hypothetical protein
MDPLAVILMVALFILVLVFIFSTALLTPLIGKKNLIFVIILGFTVGAVGGAFFIAPVLDDIPEMASSIFHATSTGTDVIGLNVSTNVNITKFLEDTKKIDGVQKVESHGITVTTSTMSDDWRTTFLNRIPTVNDNITSIQIPNNKTMILEIKNGTNPQDVVSGLETWMMYVSGQSITYSVANVTLDVEASKLNQVMAQLPQGEIIITSITGPTENNVQEVQNMMPQKSNIIIFCGFLGMITGLAGMFIDSISTVIARIRDKIIELRK